MAGDRQRAHLRVSIPFAIPRPLSIPPQHFRREGTHAKLHLGPLAAHAMQGARSKRTGRKATVRKPSPPLMRVGNAVDPPSTLGAAVGASSTLRPGGAAVGASSTPCPGATPQYPCVGMSTAQIKAALHSTPSPAEFVGST